MPLRPDVNRENAPSIGSSPNKTDAAMTNGVRRGQATRPASGCPPGRIHRRGLLLLTVALGVCSPPPLAVAQATVAATTLPTRPEAWTARWIGPPNASPFDVGVYHFRRAFDLAVSPARFVIHVSADNRYQLFVNGTRVVWGPARGHLSAWPYETVDIARHLRPGRNLLAAVVWNFGEHAPLAQHSWQTGLMVQGHGLAERIADSSPAWVATTNRAYTALPIDFGMVRGYWAAGPGERLDGALYPWGWEQPDFDASSWKPAVGGPPARPREARDAHSRHMLAPRSVPLMEERPERLPRHREVATAGIPAGFPAVPVDMTIGPRSRQRLLLDRTELTTAYPELELSGGKGARVGIRYAEALFTGAKGNDKGHRDEVAGKTFAGYGDEFLPDGGARRLFRPLWWRTFRYIELTIETGESPLVLHDIRAVATSYPFVRTARFEAGRVDLDRMVDVGWRTARVCAHETYMDCPYYEQLQYAGDTRIQALVSYYMSGDARLARQAIEALDASRTYEGLTFSRAPSRLPQYIPPFSLWWIGMVHDFARYQDDAAFVKAQMAGVRAVLAYFRDRQRPDGHLADVGWWPYVDWVRTWEDGVPPVGARGESAPLDLQLLLAYQYAADLEADHGSRVQADANRVAADALRASIRRTYWSPQRRLFLDTADGAHVSQHTQALAILAGVAEPAEKAPLAERMLSDADLAPASIYFKYYVHQAVIRAGLGDRYLGLLGEWRRMLDLGLTTWAETAEPTRSDAHAWGASPNIEFLRTVLGVDSAAPGFARVAITPHLGALTRVSGRVPHPKGFVDVSLRRDGDGLAAEVTLPAGVSGELFWKGKAYPLRPGLQAIAAP
jgi:alpha-L-rhamnosidase